MEHLLKVEEVSEILGLAPSTVRRMLWEGRLARVKIGRSTRVREGDVGALIRLGMHNPEARAGRKPDCKSRIDEDKQ
jgi:excisionase family DNA binding protein